ncbi:MAG: PAS domain-containing protein, partial [Verrucomicrobiota bacterium]
MQKPASTQSAPAPAAASSRETRLSTRETFFKQVRVAAILRAFDEVPGLLYVVKDRESRVMAISPESVKRMGYGSEEEIIGQTVHEYLPGELADKFLADDHWVLAHGEPRREMTELWFSPE